MEMTQAIGTLQLKNTNTMDHHNNTVICKILFSYHKQATDSQHY